MPATRTAVTGATHRQTLNAGSAGTSSMLGERLTTPSSLSAVIRFQLPTSPPRLSILTDQNVGGDLADPTGSIRPEVPREHAQITGVVDVNLECGRTPWLDSRSPLHTGKRVRCDIIATP